MHKHSGHLSTRVKRRNLDIVLYISIATLAACGGGGSGGENSAATTSQPAPPVSGSGSSNIELAWSPPTSKTDGSALMDLAGYRFHMGRTSGEYDTTITVDNPGLSRYVIENLQSGTWYVAMSALRANGIESDLSNEVRKVAN